MTNFEHLVAIRALLTPFDQWTQGASARTANGMLTQIESDGATCWCLFGATCKTLPPTAQEEMYKNLLEVTMQVLIVAARNLGMPHRNVAETNDHDLFLLDATVGRDPAVHFLRKSTAHERVLLVVDEALKISP
jgi:hypothetical protein